MDGDFGANFDDELFYKTRKKPIDSQSVYQPKNCHKTWFITSENDGNLELMKYRADYYYSQKNYELAADAYKKCLNDCGFCNATVKRDCLEGLVFSLINVGSHEAISYAEIMHSESCNVEQKIGSSNLLAAVFHWQGKHEDELEALQFCIMHHPLNADLWLRLAVCYARLHDVPLGPVCGESSSTSDYGSCPRVHRFTNHCSCAGCPCRHPRSSICSYKSRKHVQIVCACLIRTKILFQGCRSAHRSFAKSRNADALKRVEELILVMDVGKGFVELAMLKMNHESIEAPEVLENPKTTNSPEENCVSSKESSSNFENAWFSFIDNL